MKYEKLFLLAFSCLFFSNYSFSQDRSTVYNNVKTSDYMRQIKSTDLSFNDQAKKIESQIRKFSKHGKISEKSLPVVFHVIKTNEMKDVSVDLIESQLAALNRDFNSLEIYEDHPNDPNKNYQSRAAIPMIQFCTPDLDDYINVWITDLEGTSSGFAQMPGGDEETDGIVIDYKFFGQFESEENPFNQGKTLTHLMGNYLGLYALWNDVDCGDDYVEDTPIHNARNYGKPEPGHISLCTGNGREMTMNFMDATYDEGKYMFTKGQVMRMHAVLSNSGFRSNLSNTETFCEKSEITALTESQDLKQNNQSLIQVELRPNPANDFVYIDFKNIGSQDYVLYQIVDIHGKILAKGELRSLASPQSLNTQNLVTGIYFMLFTFDSQAISKKLIID